MKWWQKQRSGDNSQNIQAVVANFGMGYEDVLAVVSNYVDSRLAALSQSAFEEARDRVEEFTVNYIHRIQGESPEVLENTRDPGVQSALLDAQSAYAKMGDEDLGQVLVEMLAKRTETTERNVQQLALAEAIVATGKLSYQHVRVLTALFLTLAVTFGAPTSPEDLYQRLRTNLSPILDGLTFSDADIQYLADTGATRIELVSSRAIPSTLRETYPGLYCKGLDREVFPAVKKYENGPMIIPCIRNPALLQVNASSRNHLEAMLPQLGLEGEKGELLSLLTGNPMDNAEIQRELTNNVPGMGEFIELWEGGVLKNSVPSIVGIAIAHANLKATSSDNFTADLNIWIS